MLPTLDINHLGLSEGWAPEIHRFVSMFPTKTVALGNIFFFTLRSQNLVVPCFPDTEARHAAETGERLRDNDLRFLHGVLRSRLVDVVGSIQRDLQVALNILYSQKTANDFRS